MAFEREDWEGLGDAIEEVIDSAVNSRNFEKLSESIRDTIEAVAGSMKRKPPKIVDAEPLDSDEPVYRPSGKVKTPPKFTGKVNTNPVRVEQKQELSEYYGGTTGKWVGSIAKIVGGSMLSVASMSMMAVGGFLSAIIGTSFTAPAVVMGAVGAGGLWLLGNGIGHCGRLKRFDRYKRILGSKTYCEIKNLARNTGNTEKFVLKDVQHMIRDGLFLEGHVDDEQTSLIISDETYRHYQQTRLQLEEQRRQQALEEARRAKELQAQASVTLDPQVQEVLDRGNAFLRQIRSCNDAIPGEEISKKISRMELIVQKIFDRAEEHPEIVPDLKKLMDYYLPMTVKLLNAYADMDAQPVQGETIRKSKQEIEATLDTLNNAFERLLDSVFKETAMDVSSDISVLQTLLAQEGLTDDELTQIKKDRT